MSAGTVLMVVPGTSIADPSAGDQVRAHELARELDRHGWEVHVLEQGPPDATPESFPTAKFGGVAPPRLVDLDPALYRALSRAYRRHDPDVVHVKTFAGVTAAAAVRRVAGAHPAVVYDAQNVEALKVRDGLDDSVAWYKDLLGPRVIPALERVAVRAADHVVAVSDRDRERFLQLYDLPESKVTSVPSGVRVRAPVSAERRRTVRRTRGLRPADTVAVFHGHHGYYPNREAVGVIADRIAPALPDVQFLVAGAGLDGPVEGFRTVGFVDDLHAFLSAADVAVVPLLRGGGTKLKMFDYMNAGLPIATTAVGAEGIDLTPGEDAVVIDSVPELVDAVADLTDDPGRRERLGANARALVERAYDWERIGTRLDELYRGLAASRGRRPRTGVDR